MGVRTKMVLILGAFVLLLLGTFFGFEAGMKHGSKLERANWLVKETNWKNEVSDLTDRHTKELLAEVEKDKLIERQTSEKHEAELTTLRAERDADRKRADAAGGLRIKAPNCTSTGAARTDPEAASTSGRNEDTTSTIRLPQPVEDGLWSIANGADEVVEQARACQNWIRSQGFYRSEPAE